MHEDCYFCIKRNICTKDVPKPCKYRYTEEERIADQASDNYGAILNGTYLHKTYRKKEEDNEMKATSVQNIKNVKDISVTVENYPVEMGSKITIVASTDDDVFEFGLEGLDLLQSCKRAGLFSGLEKDQTIRELKQKLQKIRELDEELAYWKKEAADCLKLRDEFRSKYDLERAANEAQHKFFREYAGNGTEIDFNYVIDDTTDEVTYVIVDKEKYEALKNCDCKVRLHGMDFTPDELVDRIRELEALKTPAIENFAVEEHSDQPKTDNVNHPSHYETGKFECIEVMQEVFGTAAVCDFCKCNAFKYIYRMDRKNGDEDVRKAIWYLNKYLELSEKIDIYKEIGGLIPRPEFVKDGGTDNGGKKSIPEGE